MDKREAAVERARLGRLNGAYMLDEAPGAPILVGQGAIKVLNDPGDTHVIGDTATVIASFGPITAGEYEGQYGYFVVWDDMPDLAVFVRGGKLAPLEEQSP